MFTDGVLTTNTGSSLYKMLVPNSYGGTEILDSNDNWLIEKQYQIGDVLNWYDGMAHYAGVYQGEGKFLVVNTDTNAAGVTKSLSEIAAEKSSYNWYFVLRPTDLVITREDMEESLKDVLWAYYTKGTWAQYESTTFNAISYTHGGYSPLGTHMNTLEDATEDTTLYTVCSNYAWSAYYEALGFPLFGYCLNPGSAYLWIMADEVPADADGDMLCVMRWHNYPCDHTSQDGDRDEEDEDNNHSSIQHSKDICCGYGNTVAEDGTPAFDLKTAYDKLYDFF